MKKIINIFGDSIVYGVGDNEMGGWANRLQCYLENDMQDNFRAYKLGISGDNSDELLKRFLIENETRNPDVIIIAIGINDSQYINIKENPRVPLEKFENNLIRLVGQAKKFTKKIVFIGLTKIEEKKLMPIPWDNTKYYDEENVIIYNAKIKEVCEKNGLLFIEMLDLFDGEDLEDGLHPNPTGHKKMFLRIKDFLIEKEIV